MADVIKFPNKHGPVQPPAVRVAALDDGFIRIPNELYEALIRADLNKREQKVAHAIARKTYGFNKQFDRISDSQLAELTGIHRTHVCKAKKMLLDRHILKREGQAIGLNKVVSEWKSPECQNSYSVADLAHTKDIIQKTQDTPPCPPQGECNRLAPTCRVSLITLPLRSPQYSTKPLLMPTTRYWAIGCHAVKH